MMRRSVVLVAMLCAAGTAFAQAPPAAGHANWQANRQQWQQMRTKMEQKRMERLAVLLDMTPAQEQRVQAIFSGERSRMQQAMKQAMAARRDAHADALSKLGQVLSPTQMKKLKLLMPRHHRFLMMRGRMGMRGPMSMPGPMGMWHPHPGQGGAPPPPPGAGPQ